MSKYDSMPYLGSLSQMTPKSRNSHFMQLSLPSANSFDMSMPRKNPSAQYMPMTTPMPMSEKMSISSHKPMSGPMPMSDHMSMPNSISNAMPLPILDPMSMSDHIPMPGPMKIPTLMTNSNPMVHSNPMTIPDPMTILNPMVNSDQMSYPTPKPTSLHHPIQMPTSVLTEPYLPQIHGINPSRPDPLYNNAARFFFNSI